MLSNGEPVDLYKLFMVVKEKGGYDAVCKNRLWDLVGEEYGLGVKVGSSVELVYSKYLSTLETWLRNVADSKFPECGLVDDRVNFGKKLREVQADCLLDDYGEEGSGDEIERVCDYLDGRKLCGTNRVRGLNPELNGAKKVQNGGLVDLTMLDHKTNEPSLGNLCSHNYAVDILDHLNENKTSAVDISDSLPGLSDGGEKCDKNGDGDDVMVLDPSSVDRESFGRKRKRESKSEMLIWLTGTAKNPCDPAVGLLPEKSKWKSYGSEEIWKQVLLFREAVFLKRGSESSSEHPSWQVILKIAICCSFVMQITNDIVLCWDDTSCKNPYKAWIYLFPEYLIN